MKNSIIKKINYLTIISLFALSVFMVAVNLVNINDYTSRNSEIMMKKTCSSQALQLNNQFELVEQSVQNIYCISEKLRPSVKELRKANVADEFVKQFQETAITIADNTEGALAIYYRMNPDITLSGTTGFFYVKSNESSKFESSPITDLNDYDVNDMEHVGWYYVPVWSGEPVWMEPYYNANIGVEMISYVVPIYDDTTLVGVVGMDVDFGALKQIAEDIDIYESNGAVLCSMTNSQVYYDKSSILGDSIPSNIYKELQGNETSGDVKFYEFNGKKYGIYYETLNNRMKLLIYALESEIYSHRYSSITTSSVIFIVVFTITLLVAMRITKRIVRPISEITEATKKYALGDWDVKVYCDTGDELQDLSENISVMAEKTKEYIKYINDMAKKDVLTGLRNKTDYTLYVEKINTEYIPERKPFAIAVFDLNNLKIVNDTFGHEKGDELLKAASQFICKSFSHSPIFRIGGDEFVAIIDGADYDARKNILEDFQKYMSLAKNSSDITEVCVAIGMATYGDDSEVFDDLFDIADQKMYENKKELKDGQKAR